MIFRRLGLINKDQRGFSLTELMLTFLIAGIITGGITMTIFSVINGNIRTSNHMTAVRQVQNAGYWVSRDAQMAQQDPVILTNGGELKSITLTWTDWDGTVHTITYTLEGTELWRDYDGQRSLVAQFIDLTTKDGEPQTKCDFVDTNGDDIEDTLILKVTATVGAGSQQQSETRVYEVVPRPE